MKTAAFRIHALVKSLGINKARVFGHDIGLMVAYAYAAQFPNEVEKLVAMDAFLPGVPGWDLAYDSRISGIFAFTAPRPKPWSKAGRSRFNSVPGHHQIKHLASAVSCQTSALKAILRELRGFRKDDAKELVSFNGLPLVVLTHDPKRWSAPADFQQAQPIWDEMQLELANLTSHSRLIVAKGSAHDIHVERPELVIEAVRSVYDSAVHNTPLEKPKTGGQVP